ncbi:MAG: LytTR family transcriptional regulator [Taibaiella sp.]|nr:LytTR family transcriptional regulator [Taibaiella sp.]
MSSMLELLKQPHPLPGKKNVLLVALLMGAAVALFLIVFQPFGLATVPGSGKKVRLLMGYGLVTAIVVFFNGVLLPLFLPRLYAAERWTLGKDLFLLGLMNFTGVALVNFFYSALVFGFSMSLNSVGFSLFATLSVGFLPFTILVLYRHNRLLQQNLQSAAAINNQIPAQHNESEKAGGNAWDEETVIVLNAEGGGEELRFRACDLLYAESADNYIKVTLLDNNTAKTTIIRQTLKQLEELAAAENKIVRCHRSFIVNMQKVAHAEGNAQGLKLQIEGCDAIVPVSRTYVPAIRSLLNTP